MTTSARGKLDRAAGVLLTAACGDALGAAFEFGPPLPADTEVGMVGGGAFGWAPGEWTDDTAMAVAIAELAADGLDLRTAEPQTMLARRWAGWARVSKDVGVQTSAVLGAAGPHPTGAGLAEAAAAHLASHPGSSAGNGSLMRTAPVALANLEDPAALDEAARAVSALTHADPDAQEACALWCAAIAHAVRHASFDGLPLAVAALPPERAAVWGARLDEAEANPPAHFTRNGWVVQALQGAWSAISTTPVPVDDPARGVFAAQHLQHALEAAVRGGNDTDTVAAIAGALLGARWGASAVPAQWRRIVHGWPGLRARDLVRLGVLAANGGEDDWEGWPSAPELDYERYPWRGALGVHPHDPGIRLGGVDTLRTLPPAVDAVVSLCRLGADEVPADGVRPEDHLEVWLVDREDANPNLEYLLHDTARAVQQLRAEGRTVLVHCVQAQSRTPTVGAAYSVVALGVPAERALTDVCAALPDAAPQPSFRAAVARLRPA